MVENLSKLSTTDVIAVGALIVALVGGIPGIISTITYFRSRPQLQFYPNSWVTADIEPSSNQRELALILMVTVANKGPIPVVPSVFEARIKAGRKYQPLVKRLMTDDMKRLIKDDMKYRLNIQIADPIGLDLQRFKGAISFSEPIYGHLFFVSNTLSQEDLSSKDMLNLELTCIDVFEKRHTSKLSFPVNSIKGNMEFPKHGFTVIYENGDEREEGSS